MTFYYRLNGEILEVYQSRVDTQPLFTRRQTGGWVTDTATLKRETAEWINAQSIPDELAFADAIQTLAVISSGDFEPYIEQS